MPQLLDVLSDSLPMTASTLPMWRGYLGRHRGASPGGRRERYRRLGSPKSGWSSSRPLSISHVSTCDPTSHGGGCTRPTQRSGTRTLSTW